MSYYNYKQQYTYGFKPVDLHDLTFASSATKFFLGENCGAFANLSKDTNDSTHTKPIDLKADKQMFVKKALLDVECLKDFAPRGVKEVFKLTPTVTTAGAGTIAWKFRGVEQPAIEVTGTDTADTLVAKMVAVFHCDGWVASADTSNHLLLVTAVVADANVAKDDAKETFAYTKSGETGTITGAWAVKTQGVAPEADNHYVKLDIMSVSTEAELEAYIAGGALVPVASVYLTPAMMVAQSSPVFEITMPSNLKALTWAEISMPNASSTNLDAGMFIAHFNPNL